MASSNIENFSNDIGLRLDLTEKFEYTWTINNFNCFRGNVGELLESSAFPDYEREDEIKWKLLMYPGGNFAYGQDFISLYLYLESYKNSQVKVINCKLSIVNVINEIGFTLEFGDLINKCGSFGYNNFIAWDHVLREEYNLLPNNRLTIFCEIRIGPSIPSANIPFNISVPNSTLSLDFGQVYDSQKFCDIALYIDDMEFKAHKAILSIRCNVFRDIFECEKHNKMEITGIDPLTFREILRFIYTGEVMNLTTSAEKLLAAADIFQLERLKFMCGRVISKNFTKENVSAILELANRHNAEDLKSQVNNFISQLSK